MGGTRREDEERADKAFTELQHNVRIRDGHGQDQAQQRHRPATSQPAQDGKGCKKSDRTRTHPQCVQTPSSAHDRAKLQEAREQNGSVNHRKGAMYYQAFLYTSTSNVNYYITATLTTQRFGTLQQGKLTAYHTQLHSRPSNHSQMAVIILNPLIQSDMIANPAPSPIPKLSLQHSPTINQSDIPRARPKIATPSPPQPPIGIRQASIQINPTLAVPSVHIATVRHQRPAVVF